MEHPLLLSLRPDEQSLLEFKHYSKNTMIFNEHEKCLAMGFVMTGEVVIQVPTFTEGVETMTVIPTGGVFGDALLFAKCDVYLGDVISNKETTVAFLKKADIIRIAQANQLFLETLLTHLANATFSLRRQQKLLLHKNIRDRIMYYLEQQLLETKTVGIYVPSITKLADYLALPRPSVSRELSKMLKEGLIKKNGKTIYLSNK